MFLGVGDFCCMFPPKATGIYWRQGGLSKPHAEGHYEDIPWDKVEN